MNRQRVYHGLVLAPKQKDGDTAPGWVTAPGRRPLQLKASVGLFVRLREGMPRDLAPSVSYVHLKGTAAATNLSFYTCSLIQSSPPM